MKKNHIKYRDITTIIIMIIVLATAFFVDETGIAIAIIGGAVGLGVALIVSKIFELYAAKTMSNQEILDTYTNLISHETVNKMPIPMLILSIDGKILWFNSHFESIAGDVALYDVPFEKIIKDIKWNDVLKFSDKIEFTASFNENNYDVLGHMVKGSDDEDDIFVLLYFFDNTELLELSERYDNEKTVLGLAVLDNYDELFQKMEDSQAQYSGSQINKFISEWVTESNGVIKHTDKDRYLIIFEKEYLQKYVELKFNLLEKIHEIGNEVHQPVSISMGLGVGENIAQSEEFARLALDMAQGRGGDQVVIKDEKQFSFFGGKSKEYEKSTRVKTRAFASALQGLIDDSDKVVFIGHNDADYDSFGAAIGLSRAVVNAEKPAYIVYDNSPAVADLVKEMRSISEYSKMLIGVEKAKEIITGDTLLVILDTHRPSMLPNELLNLSEKIVLIDHHRRSTEFLEHISLLYHEPYASSTCEMATEILQYIDDDRKITPFEVKALYVGMLMDTKNFMQKTGVRTFEAASYLRRYGLDLIEVKKLFTMDKTDYAHKLEITQNTEIFADNVAVAYTKDTYSNIRVIASLAADDMLNITSVKAAFVVYEYDDEIFVSARSLGDINVQLVCEKLNGGGHITVAGAQMQGIGLEDAIERVKQAILDYINENTEE